MPRTKHRLGQRPTATRQFTDREQYLEAFEHAAAAALGAGPRVLAFYGVGGIGKTSLLNELRRRLKESPGPPAHAGLDLRDGENRLPASANTAVRVAFLALLRSAKV